MIEISTIIYNNWWEVRKLGAGSVCILIQYSWMICRFTWNGREKEILEEIGHPWLKEQIVGERFGTTLFRVASMSTLNSTARSNRLNITFPRTQLWLVISDFNGPVTKKEIPFRLLLFNFYLKHDDTGLIKI